MRTDNLQKQNSTKTQLNMFLKGYPSEAKTAPKN